MAVENVNIVEENMMGRKERVESMVQTLLINSSTNTSQLVGDDGLIYIDRLVDVAFDIVDAIDNKFTDAQND